MVPLDNSSWYLRQRDVRRGRLEFRRVLRRRVAQELAVELVAVDVEDPRVVAGGIDLIGHVDPVIIGRQRRPRGDLEDQAIARATGLDQGRRDRPVGADAVVVETDRRPRDDRETRAGRPETALAERAEIAVGRRARRVGRADEHDVGIVEAGADVGDRVGQVDDERRGRSRDVVAGVRARGRRQLVVRLRSADGRRAAGAVAALHRHAGDVRRRGLDGQVQDEVVGAFAGDRGIVEVVAGGVGQARILELVRVGDQLVLARRQAGGERQVHVAVIGGDEAGGVHCGGLGDEGRAGDELRLVGVGRDVDQGVIADVGGRGRVERVELDRGRRPEWSRLRVDRIGDRQRERAEAGDERGVGLAAVGQGQRSPTLGERRGRDLGRRLVDPEGVRGRR